MIVAAPMARVHWKFTMTKMGWRGVIVEGAGEPCGLAEAESSVRFLNQVFGEGSHWCVPVEQGGTQ